jgi:hypothetical protein
MKKLKPVLIITTTLAAIVLITLGGIWLYTRNAHYDFYKTVPPAEAMAREKLVKTAEGWLGYQESDGTHKAIIDLYNAHEPLAQNYMVKYDDEWCATFVSAAAIQCGFTDIIPTECGCQRQIELFKTLNAWEEADDYKPLPGDIIYYCWKDTTGYGDCTGWSDHVGIVVGTAGDFIKVIEGNNNEQVSYRYISVDAAGIRGYAVPNYFLLEE